MEAVSGQWWRVRLISLNLKRRQLGSTQICAWGTTWAEESYIPWAHCAVTPVQQLFIFFFGSLTVLRYVVHTDCRSRIYSRCQRSLDLCYVCFRDGRQGVVITRLSDVFNKIMIGPKMSKLESICWPALLQVIDRPQKQWGALVPPENLSSLSKGRWRDIYGCVFVDCHLINMWISESQNIAKENCCREWFTGLKVSRQRNVFQRGFYQRNFRTKGQHSHQNKWKVVQISQLCKYFLSFASIKNDRPVII